MPGAAGLRQQINNSRNEKYRKSTIRRLRIDEVNQRKTLSVPVCNRHSAPLNVFARHAHGGPKIRPRWFRIASSSTMEQNVIIQLSKGSKKFHQLIGKQPWDLISRSTEQYILWSEAQTTTHRRPRPQNASQENNYQRKDRCLVHQVHGFSYSIMNNPQSNCILTKLNVHWLCTEQS